MEDAPYFTNGVYVSLNAKKKVRLIYQRQLKIQPSDKRKSVQ